MANHPDRDPASERRHLLLVMGISLLIGVLAAVLAWRTPADDRGPVFWLQSAVALTSLVEVTYYVTKYRRLGRQAERIN